MIKIEGSASGSGSESESGSISQRHVSADPDQIRTKMSWVRNTDLLLHPNFCYKNAIHE
jgi:hypothetical protein